LTELVNFRDLELKVRNNLSGWRNSPLTLNEEVVRDHCAVLRYLANHGERGAMRSVSARTYAACHPTCPCNLQEITDVILANGPDSGPPPRENGNSASASDSEHFHPDAPDDVVSAARARVVFRNLEQKVRDWIDGVLLTPFTADEELVIDRCAVLWYLRNHGHPLRTISAKHYTACSPECCCQQALRR